MPTLSELAGQVSWMMMDGPETASSVDAEDDGPAAQAATKALLDAKPDDWNLEQLQVKVPTQDPESLPSLYVKIRGPTIRHLLEAIHESLSLKVPAYSTEVDDLISCFRDDLQDALREKYAAGTLTFREILGDRVYMERAWFADDVVNIGMGS